MRKISDELALLMSNALEPKKPNYIDEGIEYLNQAANILEGLGNKKALEAIQLVKQAVKKRI